MTEADKFFQGTGRRKRSVARVRISLGDNNLFMVDGEQPVLEKDYVDVGVIKEIKQEFVEDVPLVRTRTPPPPIAVVDDEEDGAQW